MSAPPTLVLFVDDDPINIRVFEANFGAKFQLVCCRSGEEALGVLEQRGPQLALVVTDQRMGKVSGVDLLERARTLVPEAARFLVTAYSDVSVVLDAVNRGQVMRYFIKPWERVEVQAAMEEAVRVRVMTARMRELEGLVLQQERLATIGQVAAGIAHELMNPLAFVTQNVQSLMRDMKGVEAYLERQLRAAPDIEIRRFLGDVPELLRDVVTGLGMLEQVARNVRNQARGADGERTADLVEIATFAGKLAQPQFGHQVRFRRQGPPARVRASPVQLSQVLLNLLTNAAHACSELGRPALISLRWEVEGDKVRLAVEDDGPGMPPEVVARAFEPLFTTKAAGRGTGLGLSICRQLVEEMGGQIALESEVGRGTAVRIALDRVDEPGPPGAAR